MVPIVQLTNSSCWSMACYMDSYITVTITATRQWLSNQLNTIRSSQFGLIASVMHNNKAIANIKASWLKVSAPVPPSWRKFQREIGVNAGEWLMQSKHYMELHGKTKRKSIESALGKNVGFIIHPSIIYRRRPIEIDFFLLQPFSLIAGKFQSLKLIKSTRIFFY